MITLGVLSDSNSFRFHDNDESSLVKVDFEIDKSTNIPRIHTEILRESSGEYWRNPKLADPHLHTFAMLESWQPFLELPDCENLLLVTSKDDVYIESLGNKLKNSCNISRLSLLNSSDLSEIDSYVDNFASLNKQSFDLILLRHSLEHSQNPLALLRNLSRSLSLRGMILLEVPLFNDNKMESFFEQFWEEHIFYFSAKTLLPLIAMASLEVVDYKIVTTENEPVLAVLAKLNRQVKSGDIVTINDRDTLLKWVETDILKARTLFNNLTKSKDVVFIGANHKSINLIDLFVPEEKRVFLLDGDAQKIGKFTTRYNIEVLDLRELDHFRNNQILTTISPKKLGSIVKNHLSNFDDLNTIKFFYSEASKLIV